MMGGKKKELMDATFFQILYHSFHFSFKMFFFIYYRAITAYDEGKNYTDWPNMRPWKYCRAFKMCMPVKVVYPFL